MREITYKDFKKSFEKQIKDVGYTEILTNIAWSVTLLRAEMIDLKKSLEQNKK